MKHSKMSAAEALHAHHRRNIIPGMVKGLWWRASEKMLAWGQRGAWVACSFILEIFVVSR